MISAAVVFEVRRVAQVEQLLEAAAAIGERALLLQLQSRASASCASELLVLLLHAAQPDVAAPDAADAATRPPTLPRCTSANTPKVTASSTGTPLFELHLRGDQDDVPER